MITARFLLGFGSVSSWFRFVLPALLVLFPPAMAQSQDWSFAHTGSIVTWNVPQIGPCRFVVIGAIGKRCFRDAESDFLIRAAVRSRANSEALGNALAFPILADVRVVSLSTTLKKAERR